MSGDGLTLAERQRRNAAEYNWRKMQEQAEWFAKFTDIEDERKNDEQQQ